MDKNLSRIMMAWYADLYISNLSVSLTSASQSMIKFRTSWYYGETLSAFSGLFPFC